MSRVLVVDDEPQIRRALAINLRARKYDVVTAEDGASALAAAARRPPDVVLLDLGLPDMDGMEVIAGLRGWTEVPIIVLSGRADSGDKIDALDAGADDYVTKPFSMGELLARLRAAERRTGAAAETAIVQVGEYAVDLGARSIESTSGGTGVHLTPTEWQVLDLLLRNPGRLVTQRQLLRDVWGPSYTTETNYLRLYLARLRRKLEQDPARPRHLLTEAGMGYRFQP